MMFRSFTAVVFSCAACRQSTHEEATRDYSLCPPMAKTCDLGFANGERAARVDSLTIAAGGLRAKGMLSFKTGVFGAIKPSKAAHRALWDKTKTQCPEFKNSF